MARIRNIKPDFFTDAELCDLSPLHRLLFQALWCQADRDGLLEDKPRELKVKCLPFDSCDVDAMLWDLHDNGFIARYESQDRAHFIAILGFAEHQKFHRDEKPRGLPKLEAGFVRPRPEDQHPASTLPARGVTSHRESDTKVPPPASTPDVGRRMSDVGCLKTEPPRVAGFSGQVSAMGGTPAPRAIQSALGVVDGGQAGSDLQEKMEAIWEQKRGRKPSRGWWSEDALRPAFNAAGGNVQELLRVFEVGLDTSYPELVRLTDLAKYYDKYAATKGPEPKRGQYARAGNQDKFRPGYEPPTTADGEIDLEAVLR